jgi:hypothetical protein
MEFRISSNDSSSNKRKAKDISRATDAEKGLKS